MKTGIVDEAKVVSIANRLRIAPESQRAGIIAELLAAIDEGAESASTKAALNLSPEARADQTEQLRAMLNDSEIKASPLATDRICRQLRALREG